jgi:hypothetical protein
MPIESSSSQELNKALCLRLDDQIAKLGDENRIAYESRFDGKWVLRTNTDRSSDQMALKYIRVVASRNGLSRRRVIADNPTDLPPEGLHDPKTLKKPRLKFQRVVPKTIVVLVVK